jgi:hypothetical protein
MDCKQLQHESRCSRYAVISLVSVTAGLLLALAWIDLSWRAHVKAVGERELGVKQLQGKIVYLDEVLTMSAMMAAATGNAQWEQRYRDFEPQTDRPRFWFAS